VKAFESVRCLSCGNAYAKPNGRGTAAANPGCPVCSYLGWLPFTTREGRPHCHSGEDRRPRPLA
jgi:hypothetical protein